MSKTEKLIDKARSSSNNFSYGELCLLATRVGFVFKNKTGSHKIYEHIDVKAIMNFQPNKGDKSKAKPYQVKQLLDFIDNNTLTESGDDNV